MKDIKNKIAYYEEYLGTNILSPSDAGVAYRALCEIERLYTEIRWMENWRNSGHKDETKHWKELGKRSMVIL